MKLKIQAKLLIYILSAALLTYIVSIAYVNYRAERANTVAVERGLRASVANSALQIENRINESVSALRSLAASTSGTNLVSEQLRIEQYQKTVYRILNENEVFDNLKIIWELKNIDNSWLKNFGSREYLFTRGDGSVKLSIKNINLDGDDFTSEYYKIKVTGREKITKIVNNNPNNPNVASMFKTIVYIPVTDEEGNFVAMVSGDIDISKYNELVKKYMRYESFANILINSDGQIVGSSISTLEKDKSDIGKIITDSTFEINSRIDSTGFAKFSVADSSGRNLTICGTRINSRIFETPWLLVSAIPTSSINSQKISQTSLSLIVIFLGLVFMAIIIVSISSGLTQFLQNIGNTLQQLSLGNFTALPDVKAPEKTNEIMQISDSVNNLKSGLNKAVEFAEEIGKGNLETQFIPLSKHDELGLSLLAMRNSLRNATEEDTKRKELDRKQNWSTEGAAKFGDILRQYNNNMDDFAFNIISNLVKYIGANQGGLFVVNDDDEHNVYFELMAGYAYNIRKILQKKVEPGVGLIGRCILENESIYINNLPEDYTNITSGLGEKNPSCLLIVPFKFNNKIYAVVEIASFTEIEPYKQEFVEEVGSSIASTIATVKINMRTNKLLEELKVQSEELASQEEEMRQNMEAMKASQEDMARKTDEFEQTYDALNQVLMVIEYDTDAHVTNINARVIEFLKKSKTSLIDRREQLYETISESEDTHSEEFWIQLRVGRTKLVTKEVKIMNDIYHIKEVYNPVQNYYGKIYKVICLIYDLDQFTYNFDEKTIDVN